MLAERILKTNESITMQIAAKAIDLKNKGEKIIDFSVGEPDFFTPDIAKKEAKKAINENKTKYTQNAGIIDLRVVIAEKFKNENNIEYSADQIIVSTGAKQCVFNAVFSLIDSGDEALIPSPYYTSYPEITALAGGNSVFIKTSIDDGFKFTGADLKKVVTKRSKVLILCSPCNPTGVVFSKEELKDICGAAAELGLYIISDEVYEKILYDDFEFFSPASLSEEIKSKTITINGASKTYAMTGWRVGYAAGPKEIINAMKKIQSHCTSNASSISQYAALAALKETNSGIEEMRKEFEERRNLIYKSLMEINGLRCVKPSGAFYVFPEVKNYFKKGISNSSGLAMYLLNEAKTAITPGIAFGRDDCMRLSFSISRENIVEGIERIKKALLKLD